MVDDIYIPKLLQMLYVYSQADRTNLSIGSVCISPKSVI